MLTIILLPVVFYAIFVASVIENAKYEVFRFDGEAKKAEYYANKTEILISAIGYLTVVCNFVSCFAMVLVLKLVLKVVKQSKLEDSSCKSAIQQNNEVIVAHVALITVYTALSILTFNVNATNGVDSLTVFYRWNSAWSFVGAVADLYISCTLWIVTDEN